MLEAAVAFIVYVAESFTGGVLENWSITTTCESRVVGHDEVEPLLPAHSQLSELSFSANILHIAAGNQQALLEFTLLWIRFFFHELE